MAAINPGVTASNAKLTIWVYNAATGAYVTSASTTGISYTAGKVTTTAVVLPATLAEGVYTFNPSAYSSTGAGLWGITNAATFVVAAAPTFTVTPNPATAGQTITVKANIDAGVTASNAKLTIWLYNASTGAYVNSASVTGLAYTAGKITSVSVTLPTLPAGSYTFNPSLYSSTGAGLWGITKAATFTVK